MAESIPPKGTPITAYPPIVRTPETTRMVDLAKVIMDLEASVAECKAQFDKLLVPETMFFLGRFGPDPFTGIVKIYFRGAEGKSSVLTTSEIRTLAQEITAMTGPGLLTYKGDRIVILLTYINKYVKNRQTLETIKAELFELGATSLISMVAPPIPGQIKAVIDSGQFPSLNVRSNSPMSWNNSKKAINSELSSFLNLNAATTLEIGLKTKFNYKFDKLIQDFVHPSGYCLTPFLIYHAKSLVDNPTPTGYWGHVARYRLHASRVAEKMSECIHLYWN